MKNTVEIDTLFVCVAWKLSFKKQTFESNRRKYSAQLIFIAILHACESNRNASSFIFFIIFYCFNCDRRQSAGTEEHVREWYTNQIANEWVTVNAICSTLQAAAAAAPKTYRSQSLAQYTKDPMNVVCASSILAVLFAHAFACSVFDAAAANLHYTLCKRNGKLQPSHDPEWDRISNVSLVAACGSHSFDDLEAPVFAYCILHVLLSSHYYSICYYYYYYYTRERWRFFLIQLIFNFFENRNCAQRWKFMLIVRTYTIYIFDYRRAFIRFIGDIELSRWFHSGYRNIV